MWALIITSNFLLHCNELINHKRVDKTCYISIRPRCRSEKSLDWKWKINGNLLENFLRLCSRVSQCFKMDFCVFGGWWSTGLTNGKYFLNFEFKWKSNLTQKYEISLFIICTDLDKNKKLLLSETTNVNEGVWKFYKSSLIYRY